MNTKTQREILNKPRYKQINEITFGYKAAIIILVFALVSVTSLALYLSNEYKALENTIIERQIKCAELDQDCQYYMANPKLRVRLKAELKGIKK